MSELNPLNWNIDQDKPDKAALEASRRVQYEDDLDTLKTYSTPSGKKVLARYRKLTIESASWMASIAMKHGMEAACAHAFAREGQNAFVRDIEIRIERAKAYKEQKK